MDIQRQRLDTETERETKPKSKRNLTPESVTQLEFGSCGQIAGWGEVSRERPAFASQWICCNPAIAKDGNYRERRRKFYQNTAEPSRTTTNSPLTTHWCGFIFSGNILELNAFSCFTNLVTDTALNVRGSKWLEKTDLSRCIPSGLP